MRKSLAFILYYVYWFKINQLKKRTDIIVSVYGHDPNRETMEKSLGWLVKNGYKFITPKELSEYINGKPIEGKLAFLSFDDGWKSNYYELLPVLEKYKIPATIFIATKGIEDGYYWIDHVRENRDSTFYKTIDEMWTMPNKKRIEIKDKLPAYKGKRVSMSRDEFKKLSNSPYIYIGNHTHDHVICDTCIKEELVHEIKTCEEKILEFTEKEVNKLFAYPNGNYNELSLSTIQELGYQMGFTTELGFITEETNIYQIPRNVLPDNASLKESILNMYNLWTPFFDSFKKIFKIKNKK